MQGPRLVPVPGDWLIGVGVAPKTVCQGLGHPTPTITLSLCVHVLLGQDQADLDAFAAALASSEDFCHQSVTRGAD